MRKDLVAAFSGLSVAMLAMGSTNASACDDGCDCGYGYGAYYGYRPAYTYYYAPPTYYARPANIYYAPAYYGRPYYSHSWDYQPRDYVRWRHSRHRRW